MDMNDRGPEPDLIINHLDQNHYSPDGSLDFELHPSGAGDHHPENHTDPQDVPHGGEDENGRLRDGELSPGGDRSPELVLADDQPPRYLSPAALKKHIHNETAKVNNELRVLITKEIRKPGRRMLPNTHARVGRCHLSAPQSVHSHDS